MSKEKTTIDVNLAAQAGELSDISSVNNTTEAPTEAPTEEAAQEEISLASLDEAAAVSATPEEVKKEFAKTAGYRAPIDKFAAREEKRRRKFFNKLMWLLGRNKTRKPELVSGLKSALNITA